MRDPRWERAERFAEDPYHEPDGRFGDLEGGSPETTPSFLLSAIISFLMMLCLALIGAMTPGQGEASVPSIGVTEIVLGDISNVATDIPAESGGATARAVETTTPDREQELTTQQVVDNVGTIPDPNASLVLDTSSAARQGQEIERFLNGIQIQGLPTPTNAGGGAPISGFFKELVKDAKSMVFVIDKSGSMSGNPLSRVSAELIFAINSLSEEQSFFVIFFDDTAWPMHAQRGRSGLTSAQTIQLEPGLPANQQAAASWINSMQGGGGTNPGGAMLMAIDAQPEKIVLLSDGEFSQQYVAEIRRRNQGFTQIDCIGLSEQIQTLQTIASENGGRYYQAK